MQTQLSGSCLCGAVRFSAVGEIKRVSACYCGQCRKQNGGGPFYGAELKGELNVDASDALRWFASSPRAQRAFCSQCGSSLFWRANDDPSYFDVSLGVIDQPVRRELDAHIFTDACPDYISIAEDAPHLTEADVHANPLNPQDTPR